MQGGNYGTSRLLEIFMTTSILAYDRQPLVARAHHLRGAVAATLVRDLICWLSAAAR